GLRHAGCGGLREKKLSGWITGALGSYRGPGKGTTRGSSVSRRLPPSPLAVTFVLLLAAVALVPLLGPSVAAFGERPFDSNTVISGTNNLLVYSSQSVAQSFLASASYRLTDVTLRLRNTGDTTDPITTATRTAASGNPPPSPLTSP